MAGRMPDYEVCAVVKKEGQEKPMFRKVGAAWRMEARDGFSIRLDFPVGVSEFCLFTPKPKEESGL
jgi:hypothetical protein